MNGARHAAKLAGETTYHGLPCKLGHTLRFVSGYHCVACKAIERAENREYRNLYNSDWRKKHPEARRAMLRRYRIRLALYHPGMVAEQARQYRARRAEITRATLIALRAEGIRI